MAASSVDANRNQNQTQNAVVPPLSIAVTESEAFTVTGVLLQ
jgi:hypothetical protein